MSVYTKNEILKFIKDEDVSFIRLQFTDVLGQMRNIAVTKDKIEDALNNECSFDGSVIDGFGEGTELYLYPDLDTFTIFPWRPHTGRVARLICDIYNADGTRYANDPRYVLQKVIDEAKAYQYFLNVGAECEFFLFKTDEAGNPTLEPHDNAGYFDLAPLDNGENCRRDISLTLEEMGYVIEASHHEAAPGQHEIDLRYSGAKNAADEIITFKNVVKTLAKRNGLHATFMPKPFEDQSGSGMHINMSLLSGECENVFYDKDDKRKLSKLGYNFIAGILKYTPEMMCLTNPTVNSYKRLMSDTKPACYPFWSDKNPSPLVRVPKIKKAEKSRVELRIPDCTANPYLVLAAYLKAGLTGIKENLEMPPESDISVSSLSYPQKRKLISEVIPSSLNKAAAIAEKSEFITELLGADLKNVYLSLKESEYAKYRCTISKWEIDNYFNC